MKRIIFSLLLAASAMTGMAQSKFVSYSPMGQEDRTMSNPTKAGILILSKCPDLVISTTNYNNPEVRPRGLQKSGYYEYEVVGINHNFQPVPKLEVSRRGDVNRTTFTVNLRPGVMRAYLVEEVPNPIAMEPQSDVPEPLKDQLHAAILVQSTIEDLHIDVPEGLGATVTRRAKRGDASVTETDIIIPVSNIREPIERLRKLKADYEAADAALNENSRDEDFARVDQMQKELATLAEELAARYTIDVYGKETNHLAIDVSDLQANTRTRYAVMQLRKVEHLSKCSGFLAEGGRLFSLRNYDEAKRAFGNALTAGDTPADMVPAINSNLAQCDSCLLYEQLTKASLLKLRDIKQTGKVTQTDVAEYYSAAVQYLHVLDRYNPCDYYKTSANRLEEFIKNMPFTLRFNVVHLKANRVSVGEAGPFEGVEVWAYSGEEDVPMDEYANRRKFRSYVKDHETLFHSLGVTDAEGVTDTEMKRSDLPTGFFFVPLNADSKARIYYKDAAEVMEQAQGTFNKRQFRIKMYTKN